MLRNKRPTFMKNGLMGYAEDIEMMRQDRSILNKKIVNKDVMPGDIVACLMKDGRTQHYAIELMGKGPLLDLGTILVVMKKQM